MSALRHIIGSALHTFAKYSVPLPRGALSFQLIPAPQTCTKTGKRGVTSVLVTDVLASTGSIQEVVVMLVVSIITGSTTTSTILGTLERCAQHCDQAGTAIAKRLRSNVSRMSLSKQGYLGFSDSHCMHAGWYEAL